MFLPAIPDFALLFKKTFPCPVCGGDIATQTVEDNFSCPHCQTKLASNIEDAWSSGLITGILIYLALTIILYLFSDEIIYIFILKIIGYGFGGIFAIYAGNYTYRYKVKIWASGS